MVFSQFNNFEKNIWRNTKKTKIFNHKMGSNNKYNVIKMIRRQFTVIFKTNICNIFKGIQPLSF